MCVRQASVHGKVNTHLGLWNGGCAGVDGPRGAENEAEVVSNDSGLVFTRGGGGTGDLGTAEIVCWRC
jgi:hypothetical protein